MTRVQTIDADGPTIAAPPESGSPFCAEAELRARAAPDGDWHLRALTDRGLEIPADSLVLNPETLVIRAVFTNRFNVDVKITGFAVDRA